MVYIWSDFCFKVVNDFLNLVFSEWVGYRIEFIVFKVKIGKIWEIFVGIYWFFIFIKVFKIVWMYELGFLLEVIIFLFGNYFLFGDYNVDLIVLDKLLKDGWFLLDLFDIYNLYNLISFLIRIIKIFIILFDLVIINNKNKVLIFGVVYV